MAVWKDDGFFAVGSVVVVRRGAKATPKGYVYSAECMREAGAMFCGV